VRFLIGQQYIYLSENWFRQRCTTFTCRRKHVSVTEGFTLDQSLTVPTVRADTSEKEQGIYTSLLSARQLNAVASTVN
jgi:membrane protein YdbS with pleckstrin-like domain